MQPQRVLLHVVCALALVGCGATPAAPAPRTPIVIVENAAGTSVPVDFGGNYLAFDKGGKIYFYAIDAWDEDRSNAQNQRRAKRRLCDSFTELLEGLVPECEDDLEDDEDDELEEDEPDER